MTTAFQTPDQAIEQLRATLPDHQDIHETAYQAIRTAEAELGLELTPPDARHLARAVVSAVQAGIHLRGFHDAYTTVDRWADSTNRHLIQPAARRATGDPLRALVLADLQQQYLGICETRREVATALLNLGRHWLDHPQPGPAPQPGSTHQALPARTPSRTTGRPS